MSTPPALVESPPRVVLLRHLVGRSRQLHGPVRLVVDSLEQPPTLPALAKIVVIRRRLRASGGDLVLAGGPETVELLQRYGLQWALPCEVSLDDAAEALTEDRR